MSETERLTNDDVREGILKAPYTTAIKKQLPPSKIASIVEDLATATFQRSFLNLKTGTIVYSKPFADHNIRHQTLKDIVLPRVEPPPPKNNLSFDGTDGTRIVMEMHYGGAKEVEDAGAS